MRLLIIFLLVIVFCCVCSINAADSDEVKTQESKLVDKKPATRKVGSDKWKAIKIDDIEKNWEEGDEEEELESEHARLERIRSQKRPKFDINDKESLKRAYKQDPSTFGTGEGAAGTSMIFVDIKKDRKTGKPKSEKEVRTLASRWTSMLQAGGLLVQLYHPGDSTILFHVERGWLTKDVMKFVSEQREVESFTLNQKKFTPKEYLQSLEDEGEL